MNDLDFLSPFMWPLAADGHIGTFHLVPKLNTHAFIYASFLLQRGSHAKRRHI